MTDISSPSPPDPESIDRYLAGELSAAERLAVEESLSNDPALEAMVVRIAGDVHSRDLFVIPDERRMWLRVRAAIDGSPIDPVTFADSGIEEPIHNEHTTPDRLPHPTQSAPRKTDIGVWPLTRLRGAMYIAAMTLLVFIGVQYQSRAPKFTEFGRWVTYSTAKGELATVTLPDGTTVRLNGESRMDVPLEFFQRDRRVRMAGEAYFSVQQSSTEPFVVDVGESSVRVLGTQFAVRRYETDSLTSVAVRSGRVDVDGTVVNGNEQVSVGQRSVSALATATYDRFAFVDQKLVLQDESLLELIPTLNRWYNVDIKLGDSRVASLHWEATLETGGPSDLVAMLKGTFGLQVVRNGRTLTLYSGDSQ